MKQTIYCKKCIPTNSRNYVAGSEERTETQVAWVLQNDENRGKPFRVRARLNKALIHTPAVKKIILDEHDWTRTCQKNVNIFVTLESLRLILGEIHAREHNETHWNNKHQWEHYKCVNLPNKNSDASEILYTAISECFAHMPFELRGKRHETKTRRREQPHLRVRATATG